MIRPYKIYNTNERSEIENLFSPLITEWLKLWVPAIDFVNITINNACDVKNIERLKLGGKVNESIFYLFEEDYLGKQLVGLASEEIKETLNTKSITIYSSIIEKCLLNLATSMGKENSPNIPTEWLEYSALGLGSVIIDVDTRDNRFYLLIIQDYITPFLKNEVSKKNKIELSTFKDIQLACSSHMTYLHTELAKLELNVEAFMNLSVGDVIVLNRSKNESIKLIARNEQHICEGKLGLSDGKIALKIMKG